MTLISVTYRLEVKSATWTKYALLDLNPIAGMLPYCVFCTCPMSSVRQD